MVALHTGVYDPQAENANLTPAKTTAVALGKVAENLPTLDGPHTPVVHAFIDVPVSGTYTLNAGFGESTHAIVTLDGREVYRKEPGGRPVVGKIELDAGKRYPVSITYMKSGSAAFWMEQVDLTGAGDLMSYINQGKHIYLIEPDGEWMARKDVIFKEARLRPDTNKGRSAPPPMAGCSARSSGSASRWAHFTMNRCSSSRPPRETARSGFISARHRAAAKIRTANTIPPNAGS